MTKGRAAHDEVMLKTSRGSILAWPRGRSRRRRESCWAMIGLRPYRSRAEALVTPTCTLSDVRGGPSRRLNGGLAVAACTLRMGMGRVKKWWECEGDGGSEEGPGGCWTGEC